MKKIIVAITIFVAGGLYATSATEIPCTQWEGPCSGIGGPYYQIMCYCDDVLRAKECGWTADPIGRHGWCSSLCLPGQKMRTDVCCNTPCGTYHGRVANNKSFYNATDATVILFNYTIFTKLFGENHQIDIGANVTVEGYTAKIDAYGIPYVIVPPHGRASYDASSADIIYAVMFYQYDDIAPHDKQMLLTGLMMSSGLGLKLFNNRDFIITTGSNNSVMRIAASKDASGKPFPRLTSPTDNQPRVIHNKCDMTIGAVVALGIESLAAAGCNDGCRNLPMPTENDFLMSLGKGVTAFKNLVDQKYGPIYQQKGIKYVVLNPYDELDHTYDTGTINLKSAEKWRFIVYPYSQSAGDVRPLVRDVNINAVQQVDISTGLETIRINGVDLATISSGIVK